MNDEPSGYESLTVCFTRFISPQRYEKQSPKIKKWYRPYWTKGRKMNDETSPIVTGSPDEIWLCYGELDGPTSHEWLREHSDVSWYSGQLSETDVKYIRADIVAEKDAKLDMAREILKRFAKDNGINLDAWLK